MKLVVCSRLVSGCRLYDHYKGSVLASEPLAFFI